MSEYLQDLGVYSADFDPTGDLSEQQIPGEAYLPRRVSVVLSGVALALAVGACGPDVPGGAVQNNASQSQSEEEPASKVYDCLYVNNQTLEVVPDGTVQGDQKCEDASPGFTFGGYRPHKSGQ